MVVSPAPKFIPFASFVVILAPKTKLPPESERTVFVPLILIRALLPDPTMVL